MIKLPFYLVILLLISMASGCTKKDSSTPETQPDQYPQIPSTPIYRGLDTLGNWKILYQDPSKKEFEVVQFPTADVGYIVDNYFINNGTFKKTVDGGKTWTEVKNLPTEANQFKAISEDIGYAYRSSNPTNLQRGLVPLYQTRNSGASWYQIFQSDFNFTTIKNIVFTSSTKGYGITQIGEFLTLDAINGNSVTIKNSGIISNHDVYDLSFANSTSGWVVTAAKTTFFGNQGLIILNTNNEGKTWNTQFTDEGQNIERTSSIFFYDENFGWVTTGSNVIYKTLDGGKIWQKIKVIKSNGSQVATGKILFLTSKKGYMINSNEILSTSDGGISWTPDCKVGNDYFNDLFYNKTSGNIWAVGGNRVFKL